MIKLSKKPNTENIMASARKIFFSAFFDGCCKFVSVEFEELCRSVDIEVVLSVLEFFNNCSYFAEFDRSLRCSSEICSSLDDDDVETMLRRKLLLYSMSRSTSQASL